LHVFGGLSIDEWGSVVAIFGGIGAAIALIVKMTSIMNRLESSIDTLNSTLNNLVNDNRDLKIRLNHIEDRFEEHIGEAKVRNQKIKALEHEVFERGKDK
jgi:regulator of replication initiation timing